MTERIAFLLS